MNRFKHIIIKEFIHIRRDPASVAMLVMMPLIFMLIFGYAVNTEVDQIYIGVLDGDQTYESRELVRSFITSDYFKLYTTVNDASELQLLIEKGHIKTALIIPSGFSKDLTASGKCEVELIVDGSDPTVARTALQSANLLSKAFTMQQDMNKGIYLSTNVWYNPSMESTIFTIPGLMGLIMQNITVMLTSFSLVREREKGTIEQLIVSPIRSYELILGKMIPYIVVGNIDFLITIGIGILYFKIPMLGSFSLLMILGNAFIFCSLAIGMMISTISKNQLQAMQMTLLIILPSVLLSGFVFPREAMPLPIFYAGYFIPLTYFLEILRGIIVKGVGIEIIYQQALFLLGFSGVLLTLASVRFKQHLE